MSAQALARIPLTFGTTAASWCMRNASIGMYVLGCYKVEELYLELGHGQNTCDAILSVGVYVCVYCKADVGAPNLGP